MTALRRRMLEDLQLRGRAPRTQPCYLEAVKHLVQHDRRAPDHMSEEELRQYFLYLLNEKQVAESTLRIHLYGIRFFYERTLQRPWPVFELLRPRHRQTLPVVLSPQNVRSLLALVQRSKARMCLQVIYACGLRLREGTQLQVSDIDPQRMLGRVRQGKGGKDRLVPLAERTLELLRVYWQRARPRPWLFPARDQQTPLPATTLQKTFTRVVRQSGLAKDASIHTLRHSYATHLLERGVSLRVIQELLSCRNRSGPKCHRHATEVWLAERRQELLPVPYFHVVLTLPQALRELVRRHIALTNHRLLSIADGQVCFRYQDSQDQRWKTMTLPAHECIRRFLQHVLPQGFHKVRYYGLWSPVHRPLLYQLELCLAGSAAAPPPPSPEPTPHATDAWCPPFRAGHLCPSCGQGLLVVIRLLPRYQREPP